MYSGSVLKHKIHDVFLQYVTLEGTLCMWPMKYAHVAAFFFRFFIVKTYILFESCAVFDQIL